MPAIVLAFSSVAEDAVWDLNLFLNFGNFSLLKFAKVQLLDNLRKSDLLLACQSFTVLNIPLDRFL
jgi:hypothetical protein